MGIEGQYWEALPDVPRLLANDLWNSQDRSHIATVNQALQKTSIALISLKFSDPSSNYLQNLVMGLGKWHHHKPPIEHSASRGWLWDVRPKENAGHRARSETALKFPWHTDCSYESSPPQFFGLHVLRADRNGGGTLSVLEASTVIDMISDLLQKALFRPELRMRVPQEFFKGISNVDGSLLCQDRGRGNIRVRFRSDIIEPLSEDARKGLFELDQILTSDGGGTIDSVRIDLTAEILSDNTVILMDNSRWLHSRTEIKDLQRHLRRIRWGRKSFESRCEDTT